MSTRGKRKAEREKWFPFPELPRSVSIVIRKCFQPFSLALSAESSSTFRNIIIRHSKSQQASLFLVPPPPRQIKQLFKERRSFFPSYVYVGCSQTDEDEPLISANIIKISPNSNSLPIHCHLNLFFAFSFVIIINTRMSGPKMKSAKRKIFQEGRK